MPISSNKYKQMSIKEFTKAAKIYDSGKSGIYEMCKYDYPKVLKELKNKKFSQIQNSSLVTVRIFHLKMNLLI